MRIGWLSTGRDPAARDLLAEVVRRARRDGLALAIDAVFCDRERGESAESDLFLDLVEELGLEAVTHSSATSWRRWQHEAPGEFHDKRALREGWREAFHDLVVERLAPHDLDLLVLAGYMLVVSPTMCHRHAMINLHPALPGGPTGTWQAVIWELLASETRETGAMMHLATAELDRGPVVSYCTFAIVGPSFDRLRHAFRRKVTAQGLTAVIAGEGEGEPLFAEIRARGARREIPLLYQTMRQFVEGTLRADAGVVAGVGCELPLDLTAQVEAEVLTEGAGDG